MIRVRVVRAGDIHAPSSSQTQAQTRTHDHQQTASKDDHATAIRFWLPVCTESCTTVRDLAILIASLTEDYDVAATGGNSNNSSSNSSGSVDGSLSLHSDLVLEMDGFELLGTTKTKDILRDNDLIR
jgi:hypothetical protein